MWLMSDQIAQQIRQLTQAMEKIQDTWKNQQTATTGMANMASLQEDIIRAFQQYNMAYINLIKTANASPTNQMLLGSWLQQLQMMNPELVLRPILQNAERFKTNNEALNHQDITFIFNEARRLLDEIKKTVQAITNYQFDNLQKLGIDQQLIDLSRKHVENLMSFTQKQYDEYDAALKKIETEYQNLLKSSDQSAQQEQLLKAMKQNVQMLGQQFDFMLKNINDFLQFKMPSASVVVEAINNVMFRRGPNA